MKRLALVAIAAIATTSLTLAQQSYRPGAHNIELPIDYQTRFIRYATVDKPDRKTVRYLYVNPEAFTAAKPGLPLPYGTLIVMEDHPARLGADGLPLLDQQGRFIAEPKVVNLLLQEKRLGWGDGYPAAKRNGEWEYALFKPDGSRNDVPLDACFTCHINTRAGQDFAFNFWDYVQTRK
jgi:Cytochrome P460